MGPLLPILRRLEPYDVLVGVHDRKRSARQPPAEPPLVAGVDGAHQGLGQRRWVLLAVLLTNMTS